MTTLGSVSRSAFRLGLAGVSALAVSCAEGGGTTEYQSSDAATDTSVLPDTNTQDAAEDTLTDAPVQDTEEPEADGAPDGSEEDASTDAPEEAGCPSGTKSCAGTCVPIDDPSTGCAAVECDPCAFDHATAVCDNGECALGACDNDWNDCNLIPDDGCEADLNTSITNCGFCGHYCSLPNAAPVCESGVCGIASCNDGFDDCDPSVANGCETNVNLDPSHCGQCNLLCQPVGYSACANKVCQTTGCPPGTGDCDGNPDTACETDTLSTVEHCGFCENACTLPHADPLCEGGKCTIDQCHDGYGDCDGEPLGGCEVDLLSSVANCGSCSAPCANTNNTSRTCDEGFCSYLCSPGFADCNGPQPGNVDDGCETVTSADVNNCGGCGVACTNDHGATQCFLGICTPTCASGFANCNGNPNDGCETATLGSDVNHCGGCGVTCTNDHGSTACVQGACVPSCSSGYTSCDNPNDGCETNTLSSAANCGGCGITCTNSHGSTLCTTGLCTPSCADGYGDCNAIPQDGCETNTLLDPSNCGGCGNVCQPVGGSACVDGDCQATACPAGTGDCDGIGSNGCETNLNTTLAHCGACGNACLLANATAACTLGKCEVAACTSGHADCDQLDPNGCEVDIASTIAHCGGCNAACSTFNNTSRACGAGLCSYVCSAGYADCNGLQPGNVDDGCETNAGADINNCGGCGIVCTNDHGGRACVTGDCVPTCSQGYLDCDGNPNNGCETSVSADLDNCGACDNTCTNAHGTTTCTSAACSPVCAAWYESCDGDPDNGCERNVSSDVNNCGDCGVKCANEHGTVACSSGVCTPGCATGWGDCDGNPDNGCETNQYIDPAHCGTCGISCAAAHASTTCSAGTCAIVACEAQYYDLDNNPANGCEYHCGSAVPHAETCDGTDEDCDGLVDEDFDKTSDANNCGACGNSCGSNTGGLCCNSVCKTSSTSDCGACGRSCSSVLLVINELHIDPNAVGDTQGEWFELYNASAFDVDIRGFVLKDLGSDTHTVTSAAPVIIPAQSYAVLSINASFATNGGVPVVYQYASMSLGNSDGDELLIVAHGQEIDRVVWGGTFDAVGKSKELSRNHRTAALNDTLTNWCTATAIFGSGDFGTPGVQNTCAK